MHALWLISELLRIEAIKIKIEDYVLIISLQSRHTLVHVCILCVHHISASFFTCRTQRGRNHQSAGHRIGASLPSLL